MKKWLLSIVLLVMATPSLAARIKDVAEVAGVRSNTLTGYGLVVGLPGTGESTDFTDQSFKSMLNNFGIELPTDTTPQSDNIAAVAVTADLPAFAKQGQKLDVTVSSIGSAESLRGGTLLQTFLKGLDGNVYATAQGNLIVGGFSATGQMVHSWWGIHRLLAVLPMVPRWNAKCRIHLVGATTLPLIFFNPTLPPLNVWRMRLTAFLVHPCVGDGCHVGTCQSPA